MRSPFRIYSALGLLLICLQGCQNLGPAARPQDLPLLPPAQAQLDLQANQQLELRAGGESRHLLAALLIEPDQVLITGVSGGGQRLLTIRYDGTALKTEFSNAVPEEIPSALILALVQLTYWPLDALSAAYTAPWSLQSSAGQRRIYLEQRPLITVTYHPPVDRIKTPQTPGTIRHWQPTVGEKIVIEHYGAGLQLVIRTLQIPSRERPQL